MLARIGFSLRGLRERLWVGPAINASLSLMAYGAAIWADRFALPVPAISIDTVEGLLSLMAGSLLAVATFAVGSMVSAYAFASNNATPRAFRLVVADDASRRALSVFVGAYVFAMLGMIIVPALEPGATTRFLLFALVVGVIARVILTFVAWVDSIARLGRMGDIINRLESATRAALRSRGPDGQAGTAATEGGPPPGAIVLRHDPADPAQYVGHVQLVDLPALQDWASRARVHVWLAVAPGDFVTRNTLLAHVAGDEGACDLDAAALTLRRTIVIATERSFAEDPCFGLHGLSEIAARALSPGINDPGTALSVIERLTALFLFWNGMEADTGGPRYPNLHLPALSPERALQDAFELIEAHGSGEAGVATALQKAYATLAQTRGPLADAAMARARDALARAEATLDHGADVARLRAAAPSTR